MEKYSVLALTKVILLMSPGVRAHVSRRYGKMFFEDRGAGFPSRFRQNGYQQFFCVIAEISSSCTAVLKSVPCSCA